MNLLEKFLARVRVDALSGCHVWTGGLTDKGYGLFYVGGRRYVRAHRWIWERTRGPIPSHLEPDHTCRNRRCVNVEHMELVTHRVNVRRGEAPAAVNARRTLCLHGHPLDGVRADGETRFCKVCARVSKRSYKQRQRQEATA